MHDGLRRFIIVALVFAISVAGLYAWRSGKEGGDFGIFDLISGRKPMTRKEKYTLSPLPRLELDDVPVAARLNEDFKKLTAAVTPSVVSVNTATEVIKPFLRQSLFGGTSIYNRRVVEPGLGSGVIVTAQGHIITNYHVIQRAKEIQVTLEDDRTYPAQVIGWDTKVDIAVLKIVSDADEEFPALRFADSESVEKGEMVFAVGNPFGLSGTVTQGIISAKDRRFRDSSADLFQTDTVINPGNSGGPLVNLNGDIVGINVAIFSGQKQTGLWQGVGLAIASNDVEDSFRGIVDVGRPVYGYLGVRVSDPQHFLRQGVGSDEVYPVVVAEIEEDSPAAKAGLQVGDVIKTFGDKQLRNFTELKKYVRRSFGKDVAMEIEREGEERTLSVSIAEYDDGAALKRAMAKKAAYSDALEYLAMSLGVSVRNLTDEEKQQLGAGPDQGGVFVTKVHRNTPAEFELFPGDLLHHCNGVEFGNAEQFARLLGASPKGEQIFLFISRRYRNSRAWHNSLVLLDPDPVEEEE